MLVRSLLVALAATSLTLAAAAPALASERASGLDRAVESENWPLAIELVDRLIEERGASDELLTYRSRLASLNTRAMLARRISPQEVRISQANEGIDSPVTGREREREAFLANRAARLAAREIRREQRNQERLLNAEIDYWRDRSGSRGTRLLYSPRLSRRSLYDPVVSPALARRISPQRVGLSQTTEAIDSPMTERERFFANRAARLAAREVRRERRNQERLLNAEIDYWRDPRRRRGSRLLYSPVLSRRAPYSRVAVSD